MYSALNFAPLKKGTARLFVSCVTRNFYKETLTNIEEVFHQLGYSNVIIEDTVCCGWPYNCEGNTMAIASARGQVNALMSQSGLDLIFAENRCYNQYTSPLQKPIETKAVNTYGTPQMLNFQFNKYFQFNNVEVLLVSSCHQTNFLQKAFKDTDGLHTSIIDFGFCCGACTVNEDDKKSYNENILEIIRLQIKGNKKLICIFDDDFCRNRFQKSIENSSIENPNQSIELLHWADLIIKYGNKKRISTL